MMAAQTLGIDSYQDGQQVGAGPSPCAGGRQPARRRDSNASPSRGGSAAEAAGPGLVARARATAPVPGAAGGGRVRVSPGPRRDGRSRRPPSPASAAFTVPASASRVRRSPRPSQVPSERGTWFRRPAGAGGRGDPPDAPVTHPQEVTAPRGAPGGRLGSEAAPPDALANSRAFPRWPVMHRFRFGYC